MGLRRARLSALFVVLGLVAGVAAAGGCGPERRRDIDSDDDGDSNNNDNTPADAGPRWDAGPGQDAGSGRDAGPGQDAGSGQDAGPGPDAGGGADGGYARVSVTQAVAGADSLPLVEIANAVVIGKHQYTTSYGTTATFYVQDKTGGRGLAVFHSSRDTAPVPEVGDVVTVRGRLSRYSGVLEVSSKTSAGINLEIAVTGRGTTSGGAYPPAGSPLAMSSTSAFSPWGDGRPSLVGNAVEFNTPLTITNYRAIDTTKADGGTTPAGFEVNGEMIVNDSLVYQDCIRGMDGGLGALDLSNGIRGVWDRYQDFYAGTPTSPAPTVPVLYPMTCEDLNP